MRVNIIFYSAIKENGETRIKFSRVIGKPNKFHPHKTKLKSMKTLKIENNYNYI